MTRWSYLVLVVYVVLAVNAQVKPDNTTIVPPETTTVTTPGTTTKTTTPGTTTTKTTTTSTSSTTTQKTSTTTETTPAPTTTAAPYTPPKYPKNTGHWLLNETSSSNVSCLVLDAAFEVKLVNATAVDVPPNADISGSCGEAVITASLTWSGGNNLNLTFAKKGSNFLLQDISVLIPEQNVSGSVENVTLFETPLNRTYKCNSESPVKLSNKIELKVASMRVEPFRASPFSGFSKEYECSSDDVSTVVPFAVGISLALLVVIVLIAYLIGRRRSRARGYQSV